MSTTDQSALTFAKQWGVEVSRDNRWWQELITATTSWAPSLSNMEPPHYDYLHSSIIARLNRWGMETYSTPVFRAMRPGWLGIASALWKVQNYQFDNPYRINVHHITRHNQTLEMLATDIGWMNMRNIRGIGDVAVHALHEIIERGWQPEEDECMPFAYLSSRACMVSPKQWHEMYEAVFQCGFSTNLCSRVANTVRNEGFGTIMEFLDTIELTEIESIRGVGEASLRAMNQAAAFEDKRWGMVDKPLGTGRVPLPKG